MTEHFELRFADGKPAGCLKFDSWLDARRLGHLLEKWFPPITVVLVSTETTERPVHAPPRVRRFYP